MVGETLAQRGLTHQLRHSTAVRRLKERLADGAGARGIQLRFIRPGKPIENAFVESFNGKFRDEHWFASVAEAQTLIEAWRVDYNTVRPHSALAGRTPQQFASFTEGARRLASARADWKDSKNEDFKPGDLSLPV